MPRREPTQDRLASRGEVGVPLVPSAAALRQEHHQIDEGQAEAADEDVLAGRERGQVTVRGEVGRQVDESVLACVRAQLPLLFVEFGVQVSLGEDDGVGEERAGAPVEPHLLAALAGAADAQGAARVVPDGDARRERGHGPLVHPAQIGPLELPVGERAAVEVRPLVQGGPGEYRTVEFDRVVGEHRDVLGLRVHPEQRGLRLPPDPSAARRERVDEMDVEFEPGVLGCVRGDPLQDAGPPRTGSHDHQRGPHRERSEPRA